MTELQNQLLELASRQLAEVYRNRDKLVQAWIAETGIHPSESVLIEQRREDGSVSISIERKDHATERDLERQLAESRAATDALDSELTKIRIALTAAGIPEVEPYQEEDVSDWERSLRAGGRAIGNVDRIKRLAESRAKVERLRGAMLDSMGKDPITAVCILRKALNG